ncbi:MAG: hypothetical protein JST89_16055 [Cyanobacteria bacterium SZAS-4]|nr:hypothetical protein [Cyanobacteria bacterium SZAS-4]
MLVLIAAITVGLIVALIFFCLNYARLLGSNSEQKKAIEAAALAAASDLSAIVIPTVEFGYVSLSDQAPIGKVTVAGDRYFLPVRGINTLIGTARADAIVATELYKIDSSPVWTELVQLDLDNTKSVITQLSTVLKAACTPTGSPMAIDRDNNKLDVYQDAQNAYIQNAIRMSGSSSYVPNSLALSVGELSTPAETNIPVPQPSGTYPVDPTLQQNNQYKSYVNIPVDVPTGKMNFVFGGIGSSARLIDVKDFTASAAGVAYHVPAIVKAEADQIIKTSQTPNGAIFHSAACAQPSSVFDVKPAPGAIAIEFPDGILPGFKNPAYLLTTPYMNAGQDCDALSAVGDYPSDAGSSLDTNCPAWPATVVNENKIADAWRITLYDWIRRAGVKVNITDVVNTQKTDFNPPNVATIDWITELTTNPLANTNLTALVKGPQIPFGVMHIYKFNQNGSVVYKSQPVAPYPYEVVGDKQLYAEKLGSAVGPPAVNDFVMPALGTLTFANVTLPDIGNGGGGTGFGKPGPKGPPKGPGIPGGNIIFTTAIDVYVRDQCRVLEVGTPNEGKHGGEPLNDTLVALKKGESNIALSRQSNEYGAGGMGAKGPPPGPKGGGANPLLGAQSDFGDTIAPAEPTLTFKYNSGAPTMRPTYESTGLTGSIRFRRQLQVTGSVLDALTNVLGTKSDIGYVGAKTGGALKTYFTTDTVTVTDDLLNK